MRINYLKGELARYKKKVERDHIVEQEEKKPGRPFESPEIKFAKI